MYIRWLRFTLWLPVHFLSRWLSGILAINKVMVILHLPWTYRSGFSHLRFFFPLSISLSSFWGFFGKLYDYNGYFVHFEIVYYPALQDHNVCIFVVNCCHSNIVCLVFLSLMMCWAMYGSSPVPLFPVWHHFYSSGNSPQLLEMYKFPS